MSGRVHFDGELNTKTSFIDKSGRTELAEDKGDQYVSRSADKLFGAFDTLAGYGLTVPDVSDCLKIGESTGLFTDLLVRVAETKTVSLDLRDGRQNPRIAKDKYFIDIRDVNTPDVRTDDPPYSPDTILSDVSFITGTLVVPENARIATPDPQVVLMDKSRYDGGRAADSKNGIVGVAAVRERTQHDALSRGELYHTAWVATSDSNIIDTHGNQEYQGNAVWK